MLLKDNYKYFILIHYKNHYLNKKIYLHYHNKIVTQHYPKNRL